MAPIQRPPKNTSKHDPLATVESDIEDNEDEDNEDEDDEDSSASSEASGGGNLRGDLECALKGDFGFKGNFAFKETFTSAPPPGLHIEGIGAIGFPLSERDAKLIEAAATPAPFGKGAETIVDATVRDTSEIHPDKLSFTNPAWTQFLRTVTKKVAVGLGLGIPDLPPPRADLYKLLIYKAGSHFLPHKDSEKSPGMFASLVIILPSKFEGGEVHVSHGDEKDVFDISPSSEFQTSALAWYTDVTHEVKPVTSGYRLAISYNLVNTLPGLPPPRLSDAHSGVSAVEAVFRKWKQGAYNQPKFSGTIAYLLDHQYNNVSLESAALKGKDAILVSNIRGIAEKQGISLRLGLLQCKVEETSYVYGNPEVVNKKTYIIKGLYDLEGDLVEQDLEEEDLAEEDIALNPKFDIIPQKPDLGKPHERGQGGFIGNESISDTSLYRLSALVMSLAEDSKTPLEIGGTSYALKKLRRWNAEGPTERNKQMARFLLDNGYLWDTWGHYFREDALFLIDLALEWGDLAIWQEVIEKGTSEGSTPKLSLDVLVRAWSVFTFDRAKHLIEQAIRDQPSKEAAMDFINNFQARVPTQDPNVVAWWEQQTSIALSIKRGVKRKAGDDAADSETSD